MPSQPQPGIFALGTASHAYLEFDILGGASAGDLVGAIAGLREPRTTMGGVNLVAGFRPELWREGAPGQITRGGQGLNPDLAPAAGFQMSATPHHDRGS